MLGALLFKPQVPSEHWLTSPSKVLSRPPRLETAAIMAFTEAVIVDS